MARIEPAERRTLLWLALTALLHGLLYVVLLPPWQHYDEPSHVEYAATIALLGAVPADTYRDDALIRTIADSMAQHRFWKPAQIPDFLAAYPPALGSSQRVHPPLYYALIAGPMGLVRGLSVEWQLYVGRLVGLIFYVLTIIAAWRIAVVLLPDEPLPQLIIPLLLLLTPSFADLMTAVNNDVLVNFAAMAMFLGCALLLREGPSPARLALALLGLLVALLTKRTAALAVIPCALAILWAYVPRPIPWRLSLGGLVAALLVGGVAAFEPGSAATATGSYPTLVARPWLLALDERYLRLDITPWLRSVSDPANTAAIYPNLLWVAFQSFWTRFSWGHIGLGAVGDWLALLVAVACAAGLVARVWQSSGELPRWQRRWIWLCLISICLAWLALIARVHPLSGGVAPYLPRGRYLFWVILPTLWLLALGWQGLIPARYRPYGLYWLAGLIGLLNLAAITAIGLFYYG